MNPPDVLPDTAEDPLVTVIVPCYNSERTIRRCLQSIVNQKTSIKFDVIVVDSSADETAEIVATEFPSVRLIRLKQRAFAGAARNVGIRATQAIYCSMIDSDCVAEPDLIERALARHREGHYAAVGGSLANGTPGSLSGWTGYLIEFKEFMPTTPMRLEKNVPTANLTYRRETLERYGCFEEDLWPAEDLLFNWKLYRAGERLLFDPAIKVTHLNRTGWRTVLSYQIRLGRTSLVARQRDAGLGFSTVAQQRGSLPGGVLLKYPLLILLMPFVRLFRVVTWLANYDRKMLLGFVVVWPVYLLAASFWSYGFLSEAWKGSDRSESDSS
jgi:glycosyltransferase involved in cell wall biosynthesis